MPAARESLLEAARAALSVRPWPGVRMVDVAAAAGVSRQTLYNEFGGKAGLGRALIRREADWYLDGVDRALGSPAGHTERLAAVAEWTVWAARARPLVRALLTGFWDARLPAPPRQAAGPGGGPSGAGELARAVRDRAAAALSRGEGAARGNGQGNGQGNARGSAQADAHGAADDCELVVRLALSYVIVPGEEPGLGELLGLLSAPNRTTGGR